MNTDATPPPPNAGADLSPQVTENASSQIDVVGCRHIVITANELTRQESHGSKSQPNGDTNGRSEGARNGRQREGRDHSGRHSPRKCSHIQNNRTQTFACGQLHFFERKIPHVQISPYIFLQLIKYFSVNSDQSSRQSAKTAQSCGALPSRLHMHLMIERLGSCVSCLEVDH
ncbi:hypothetical protein ACFQU1_12745 [Chelatococcus sp. GCM10030263]|uniref:hypothetical protein n=1 Tax=Chelatococcus sp. GCM10030263 TaxID=3273387 RepID=UPI00361E9748